MTISAKVIADSVYRSGPRLTTMVLRYPRFVHAEFMTHRVFSRNAASSRAIPVKTMIKNIIDDPAMPVYWGKNQAGMQAAEELTGDALESAKLHWLMARDQAITVAEVLMAGGLHKQIANRILEPWMHIEVVVTATDWDNFYALRDHPMAQPEIQELARKMLEAHNASTPKVLTPGQWHLPYIDLDQEGMTQIKLRDFAEISAAKCARVSYLNHEGKPTTTEEDFALFDRLMGGDVKHASPTEHQAKAPTWQETASDSYPKSNLRGWVQHRKLIEGETIHVYEKLRSR